MQLSPPLEKMPPNAGRALEDVPAEAEEESAAADEDSAADEDGGADADDEDGANDDDGSDDDAAADDDDATLELPAVEPEEPLAADDGESALEDMVDDVVVTTLLDASADEEEPPLDALPAGAPSTQAPFSQCWTPVQVTSLLHGRTQWPSRWTSSSAQWVQELHAAGTVLASTTSNNHARLGRSVTRTA